MANPEQVEILKQGVKVWNKWREDKPDIKPDIYGVNFRDEDFRKIELQGVNFSQMILWNYNLTERDLSCANLQQADLTGANLKRAILNYADLSGAKLISTQFFSTYLSYANLSYSDLSYATFAISDFTGANLKYSVCGFTVFADLDLSETKGLDSVEHNFPSYLDASTIFRSKGKIPEIFLRGCGVPETLITFLPSMQEEAIQFYSCFISYSHADKEFAKRLHDRLQGVGIRCWLDEHQLNPGDKLHPTIYEAIRVYDKVILCCSETALKSWWVEKEFENAVANEEDYQETLLIPVSLDNYLFEQSADEWLIGEIRKKRLVQSFVNWKDHDTFEAAFEKVVKALRTDGGKPPPPPSKLTKRK